MLNFIVDDSRCTRCGLCVTDCPARIIGRKGSDVPYIDPEREGNCMQCQHCLAVCPAEAISILGRRPEDSLSLAEGCFPSLEQMTLLLRGRRSVRQYREENVDPALIRQILATLAHAPTGANQRKLTFSVVDDGAVMARFQGQVLAALTTAAAEGRLPERYAYLRSAIRWKPQYAINFIFRGAPHALIVSAPPDALTPREDIPLALAYFELLAQSAGLGTVWWGFLRIALEIDPGLYGFLGLPADHHVYGMLFGYPAVRYPRTVQREDGAVIRRVAG